MFDIEINPGPCDCPWCEGSVITEPSVFWRHVVVNYFRAQYHRGQMSGFEVGRMLVLHSIYTRNSACDCPWCEGDTVSTPPQGWHDFMREYWWDKYRTFHIEMWDYFALLLIHDIETNPGPSLPGHDCACYHQVNDAQLQTEFRLMRQVTSYYNEGFVPYDVVLEIYNYFTTRRLQPICTFHHQVYHIIIARYSVHVSGLLSAYIIFCREHQLDTFVDDNDANLQMNAASEFKRFVSDRFDSFKTVNINVTEESVDRVVGALDHVTDKIREDVNVVTDKMREDVNANIAVLGDTIKEAVRDINPRVDVHVPALSSIIDTFSDCLAKLKALYNDIDTRRVCLLFVAAGVLLLSNYFESAAVKVVIGVVAASISFAPEIVEFLLRYNLPAEGDAVLQFSMSTVEEGLGLVVEAISMAILGVSSEVKSARDFVKKFAAEMKTCKDIREGISNFIDFVKRVLKYVGDLCNIQWMRELGTTFSEIRDYAAEVRGFIDKANRQERFLREDAERMNILHQRILAKSKDIPRVREFDSYRKDLNDLLILMRPLLKKVTEQGLWTGPRVETVGVLFGGPVCTGKSFNIPLLAEKLIAKTITWQYLNGYISIDQVRSTIDNINNELYISAKDSFNEGYISQMVEIFDEFMAARTAASENPNKMAEVMQRLSGLECRLAMAFEGKGNTFYRSLYFLATTNAPTWDHKSMHPWALPGIDRRFIKKWIVPKKEYCKLRDKDGNLLNLNDPSKRQFDMNLIPEPMRRPDGIYDFSLDISEALPWDFVNGCQAPGPALSLDQTIDEIFEAHKVFFLRAQKVIPFRHFNVKRTVKEMIMAQGTPEQVEQMMAIPGLDEVNIHHYVNPVMVPPAPAPAALQMDRGDEEPKWRDLYSAQESKVDIRTIRRQALNRAYERDNAMKIIENQKKYPSSFGEYNGPTDEEVDRILEDVSIEMAAADGTRAPYDPLVPGELRRDYPDRVGFNEPLKPFHDTRDRLNLSMDQGWVRQDHINLTGTLRMTGDNRSFVHEWLRLSDDDKIRYSPRFLMRAYQYGFSEKVLYYCLTLADSFTDLEERVEHIIDRGVHYSLRFLNTALNVVQAAIQPAQNPIILQIQMVVAAFATVLAIELVIRLILYVFNISPKKPNNSAVKGKAMGIKKARVLKPRMYNMSEQQKSEERQKVIEKLAEKGYIVTYEDQLIDPDTGEVYLDPDVVGYDSRVFAPPAELQMYTFTENHHNESLKVYSNMYKIYVVFDWFQEGKEITIEHVEPGTLIFGGDRVAITFQHIHTEIRKIVSDRIKKGIKDTKPIEIWLKNYNRVDDYFDCKCRLADIKQVPIEGSHLVRWTFPTVLPLQRNILAKFPSVYDAPVKHLLTTNTLSGKFICRSKGKMSAVETPCSFYPIGSSDSCPTNVDGREWRNSSYMDVPTIDGDCGGIGVISDTKLRDVHNWSGLMIHYLHYGETGDSKRPFGARVYREDFGDISTKVSDPPVGSFDKVPCSFQFAVKDEIDYDEDGFPSHFTRLETLQPFKAVNRSSIKKSVFYEELVNHPLYGPPTKKPAKLREGPNEGEDPCINGFRDYSRNQIAVNQVAIDFLNDVRTAREHSTMTKEDGEVLSHYESVCGKPSLEIAALNRQSSPGWLFSLIKDFKGDKTKGKGLWMGEDDVIHLDSVEGQQLLDHLEICDKKLRSGDRIYPVNKICVKDERVSVEKVRTYNSRVFFSGEFAFLALMRRYTGHWCAWRRRNRIRNGALVGINPYKEWGEVYQTLASKGIDHCMFADFSKYDKRMLCVFIYATFAKIEKWYKLSPYWKPEDEMARRMICEELVNSVHIVNHKGMAIVFMMLGAHNSGEPCTAEINCDVNDLYHLYVISDIIIKNMGGKGIIWSDGTDIPYELIILIFVWLFYGDDVAISATPECEKYGVNTITLSKAMWDNLRLVYTDEVKSGVLVTYKNLFDCQLISRGFRIEWVDGEPVVCAPLKDVSHYEALMWTKRGVPLSNEVEKIQRALFELALKGEEEFNLRAPHLCEMCFRFTGEYPKYSTYRVCFALVCKLDYEFAF